MAITRVFPPLRLSAWGVFISSVLFAIACDSGSDPEPEPDPDPVAASAITGLSATDAGDGTLQVDFNPAADESSVREYRIITVASSEVTDFDLAAANSVGAENYLVVAKSASPLSATVPFESTDNDGDALVAGALYRIFVLSVADGVNATVNALSAPSSPVSITLPIAGAISNLTVSDVSNNGNETDLQVSFDRATNESTIAEYRIMVVPAVSASSFGLESAESITQNFTSVPKTGDNISLTLPMGAVDVDGAAITNDVAYRIFVLSVADGVNATINTLSDPSATLTLTIPSAGAATSVMVDDVSNNGNGSDLQVSFNRALDESTVSAYRIIVVRSEDVGMFDLESANGVLAGNYTTVEKTGENVLLTLPENATDKDGSPIADGFSYTVFVLSMADGVIAGLNTLSAPSNSIEMAVTTVTVTYVGNDGVMISDGEKKVIIDGLQRGIGWIDMPTSETSRLEQAQPPYNDIDVGMVTHNHGDHYNSSSISNYLNNNADTRILAPPQVRNNLAGFPRVEVTNLARHTKEDITVNGVEITIYHLKHFDQFSNDFSTVENYGYLVRLGGLKLLHLGDVEYSVENFENFNLAAEEIDVVFLPTFNTLLSTANRDIIMDQINPKLVIGLHFQRALVSSESAQVLSLYPNADVFTVPLEARRY